MTPEQVADAMAGQAPLSKGSPGDRLGGKLIGNVGEYRLGEARFRSVYHYDDRGLAHVALDKKSGNCREILEAVVNQYGKPVRISDQVLFRLIIWHDRDAGNRIRLLLSKDICHLNYERLSDYEDVDLAAAQQR